MGKSRRMPLHAPATATPGPASYHAQRASDEHAAGPAFSMPRAPRLRAAAPEIIGPGRYDVMPSAPAFSRSPRRLSRLASCQSCVARADASGDTARLFPLLLRVVLCMAAPRSLSLRRTFRPSCSRARAFALAQPLDTSVDASAAFAFGRDTRGRAARSDVPGPGAYEVRRACHIAAHRCQ